MSAKRKVTVYLDRVIYMALRMHATKSKNSRSEIISEALETHLHEELEELEEMADIKEIAKRKKEKCIPINTVLKELKLKGKI